MPSKKRTTKPHLILHKDGTPWAKGRMIAGKPTGYWEWFRKDGCIMRSGHFKNGAQTGEWITYDRQGKVYKITQIKPPAAIKTRRP